MKIESCLLETPLPKRETRKLLSKVTGYSSADLFLRYDYELSLDQEKALNQMVAKRKEGYPLDYLLEQTLFFGRIFTPCEDVLIPRPETEHLVEMALDIPANSILDLCTGSGVIAISLAKEKRMIIDASDVSEKALTCAKFNAEKLHALVNFISSDLFSSIEKRYDLIVSNPPYIDSKEMEGLEVAKFEPHLALDGGQDGLEIIESILKDAREHLKPQGYLLMEIGYDQAQKVSLMAKELGYENIEVSKDLAGLDRYIKVIYA